VGTLRRAFLTEKEKEERRLKRALEKAERQLARYQQREEKELLKVAEKEAREQARAVARASASKNIADDLRVRAETL
jgi:tRNA G18 (ribose-2'-O)-methylase SpoU